MLLIGGAIALAAYEIGRRSGQSPPLSGSTNDAAAEPAAAAPREAMRLEPSPVESGATIEIPLGGELPAAPSIESDVPSPVEPAAAPPPPPLPPIDERPVDEPGRCLTLDATPNTVSAYGSAGPAVQLVVRARNGCATAFSGSSTYFRVVAAGANGFPFASVNGRFSGPIPAYGTAETLVAITGDATRITTYRAELR